MPREIWSIQLEVTLAKALAQLTVLEKRLQRIELRFKTMGAGVSPMASKNMVALTASTKAAGNSALVAGGKFAVFGAQMKLAFADFTKVLARRLAFTVAALVEVFTFGLVLAIPLAFAASIKAGAAFEDAMLRTATVASGGVENMSAHFKLLAGAARGMAIEVAFSATEVATAMFEMVSAGISTTETIAAMPAVINLAGAAMTDLGTSVDIMTQIMKSFGLEAEDLDDISDVLVMALNTTTLTVGRLQAAFRFAAPAGGAFAESVEQTTAVMALFVDATKQGGIAGRAYRFMLSALANPSAKAAVIFGTLRDKVTNVKVAMLDIEDPTVSAIDVLSQLSTTSITTAQVLEAFGNRSGPVVALALIRLRASYQKADDTARGFTNTLTDLEDLLEGAKGADTARVQYARFLESTSNQFKLLGAVAEEVLLSIFERIQEDVMAMLKFTQAVLGSKITLAAFRTIVELLIAAIILLATKALVKLITNMKIVQILTARSITGMTKLRIATAMASSAMTTLMKAAPLIAMWALVNVMGAMITRLREVSATTEDTEDDIVTMSETIDENAREWNAWHDIGDRTLVVYDMLIFAMGRFIAAAIDVTTYVVSLGGWFTWLNEKGTEAADTVRRVADEHAAEAEVINRTLGTRRLRLTLSQQEAVAMKKNIDMLAEKFDLTKAQAKALYEFSEEQIAYLNTLGSRIDKEEEANNVLMEGVEWELKRKIAAKETDEVTREQSIRLLDLIEKNKAYTQGIKTETERLADLKAAFQTLFPEQEKIGGLVAEMALGLDELANRGFIPTNAQIQIQVERLNEWEDQIASGNVKASKGLREELAWLRARLMSYTTAQEEATVAAKGWADELDLVVPSARAFEQAVRDSFETLTPQELEENIVSLVDKVRKLKTAGLELAGGFKSEVQQAFLNMAVAMFKAENDTESMMEKMAAAGEVVGTDMPQSLEEAEAALEEFADEADESGKKVETSFEKMWGKVTDGMGNAFGEMLFKAKTFREFMVDTFKGMAKMIIGDSIGKLVGGVTSALSSIGEVTQDVAGEDMVTTFGDALGNIGKLFTEFNGDTIGLMIGLGMAVFNILSGLFGGDGELKNVFADMSALVGDISDELGEKIRETARELGRAGAEAAHMGDTMDEVGVTVDNFAGFVEIARMSLHALNSGAIDTHTATTQLNDNFARLTEEMTNLGIVGSRDVILLLNQIRDSGLEVASVIAFVDTNMRSAAEGLATVVNASLIDTQAELDRLGRLAFVVFSEMIKNGSSLIEALDALAPALEGLTTARDGSQREVAMQALALAFLDLNDTSDEARDAFLEQAEALGFIPEEGANVVEWAELLSTTLRDTELKGGAALDQLLHFRQLVEQNRAVVEGFEGLNLVMEGLANVGLLNQETFEDLLLQAGDLATDLTNAGVSGRDAFMLMAPFLDNIIEQAIEHGLEIDDATQKLIDQADEYGVLGQGAETETDIMKQGFDLITRAINRLITTMGGIPIVVDGVGRSIDDLSRDAGEAFKGIAENGKKYFDELAQAGGEAADSINDGFDDVEENLVGNTVFRNIQEKGGKFLEKLGEQGIAVSQGMDFSSAEGSIPGVGGRPGSNFITTTPQPGLSEGARTMSKFEKQNLAILSKLVDAVISTGKSGGSGNAGPQMLGLRQTIGDMMRDASIDGDIEVHADSVALLN